MNPRKTDWKLRMVSITKQIGAIIVVALVIYAMRSIFEFPNYIIGLVLLIFTYVEIRFSLLAEKIGIAALPTFERQLKFLHQKEGLPKHVSADLRAFPLRISPAEETFFWDFESFADIVNQDLFETAWRLHSLADTDVGTFGSDGPVFGRKYAIYFGSDRVGRLILVNRFNYSHDNPIISVGISVSNARRFPVEYLNGFVGPLAHLTCKTAGEHGAVVQAMLTSMLEVLWPLNQEVINLGELELHYSGSAEHFLSRVGVVPYKE